MKTERNSNNRVYYFGNHVEYKYLQIIKHLPIDYIPTNFIGILKGLLFRQRRADRTIVHIRYIQFRGYIVTTLLYAALILACKIRSARIVWSCHNIYEHGIPSPVYGDFLRGMLSWACFKIIVFHPSLKKHLGRQQHKVIVANFGGFKAFVLEKSHNKNSEFLATYQKWLGQINRTCADIVFVGEYKARKNIEMLIEFAHRNSTVNILIVAHKAPSIPNCPTNLLLHNQSMIYGELDIVLRGKNTIGFVAHDNYSVPTGVHLYADYGVPILGVDIEPVSCFIDDYRCGEVFTNLDDLKQAYANVSTHYNDYSNGMKKLAAENTWERSAESHLRAFDLSPEIETP